METVEVSRGDLRLISEAIESGGSVLDFVISELRLRHEQKQPSTTDYQLAVMLEMIDHRLSDQWEVLIEMLGSGEGLSN